MPGTRDGSGGGSESSRLASFNNQGIYAGTDDSSPLSTVVTSNVTVTGNMIGLFADADGEIVSFSNNRIVANQTNGTPNDTLPED